MREIEPVTFWSSNSGNLPRLFDFTIRYLSMPGNSIDAECSVSQYTAVNAPQRQSFSDTDLAVQAMVTFSAWD